MVRLVLITPHGDLEPCVRVAGHGGMSSLITPHGDLERGAVRDQRTELGGLITPHGDLEPAPLPIVEAALIISLPLMGIWNSFTQPLAARPVLSLPLMGIWNPDRPRGGPAAELVLITPHGDLERRAQRDRAQRRHLITPHGDLEPCARPSPPPVISTHYPSWGFGTG